MHGSTLLEHLAFRDAIRSGGRPARLAWRMERSPYRQRRQRRRASQRARETPRRVARARLLGFLGSASSVSAPARGCERLRETAPRSCGRRACLSPRRGRTRGARGHSLPRNAHASNRDARRPDHGRREAHRRQARGAVRPHAPRAGARLGLLSRRTRPVGVLLFACIAVHATDLSVDDGMNGMGEDELAAVAPSVDIAPDCVAGHMGSMIGSEKGLSLAGTHSRRVGSFGVSSSALGRGIPRFGRCACYGVAAACDSANFVRASLSSWRESSSCGPPRRDSTLERGDSPPGTRRAADARGPRLRVVAAYAGHGDPLSREIQHEGVEAGAIANARGARLVREREKAVESRLRCLP